MSDLPRPGRPDRRYDAVIVGAGVFGAWTAEHLRRVGQRVLLVDHMGAGHSRAASGGESRIIRTAYGAHAHYAGMAAASLGEWRALSDGASPPLFHPTGVLLLFSETIAFARDTLAVHRELNIPIQELEPGELARRWPQIDFQGVSFGLLEPDYGALMARRAVQEVVRRFIAAGGAYRIAHAAPCPDDGHAVRLNGETIHADAVVYACGAWLGRLFPNLVGPRLFVTRQEVMFVAPPDGDDRFEADALPVWADFSAGDLYYGFPNLEARGAKLAWDRHGPAFDPETGDRHLSADGEARLRQFMERRFPALAGRPLTESRVCQYANSSNGDFLIDRHPELAGAWLVGAGSGHGFKHGPEVGRIAAELVSGQRASPDPCFAFASKAASQSRGVQ